MAGARSNNGHEDTAKGSNTDRKASFIEEMASDEQVVDIDRWAESLARILDDVPEFMCSAAHRGRISRIPETLLQVNVKAYEPHFLSIGPYHHGRTRVQRMEMRKRVVLKCFLEQKPELTLKDYMKEIKSFEVTARSFYTDVGMDEEEFAHMLLLDSLCILIAFCGLPISSERMNQGNTRMVTSVETDDMNERTDQLAGDDDENIPLIARAVEPRSGGNNIDRPRWFWILFAHDLFLLENQIPFFVLQKIYSLAYGGSEAQLVATLKFAFGQMLSEYTKLGSEMVVSPFEEVHHLLHLCHMFFRPTFQPEPTTYQHHESSQNFRLESAVQLYEAGVTFEARSSTTQFCLLDIIFSKGKLVMPCLHVDDNTESLLRNLVAFEQMKYPSMGLNISAYVVLLLHLITVPEDVKLLRKKGIIQHHLASDKEMMYLINQLSVGLAFDYVEDNYSLKPVFQELKSFSDRRGPRWKAWLKHRYLSNPWTVISLLAASLLLLLSIVETYYTVYSYYHPCSHCSS